MLAVLRGTEKLEVLARRHLVSANPPRRTPPLAGRVRGRRPRPAAAGQGDGAAAALENQRLTKELAERELIIGEITVANRFLQKKVDGALGTTSNGKS